MNKWQVMAFFVNQMILFSPFTGWQWRSTSTSTPGWKDAAALRWKRRWTRWLRMLVCHIRGRILLRTCQVCLFQMCVFQCLIEIMQRCKFHFLICSSVSVLSAFISPGKEYHLQIILSIQDKAFLCQQLSLRIHTHVLCICVSQVVIHCLGGHEQVLLDKLSPVTDCLWAKYDFQGWSMLTFPLH